MISHRALEKNATTRLWDARVLLRNKRYDSAIYLCGYAIELGLKAIICKNLKLKGIPSTSSEFSTIQDLKTHKLEKLLELSGQKVSQEIKKNFFREWGIIANWDPEARYAPIRGKLLKVTTEDMIKATRKVLKCLCVQL